MSDVSAEILNFLKKHESSGEGKQPVLRKSLQIDKKKTRRMSPSLDKRQSVKELISETLPSSNEDSNENQPPLKKRTSLTDNALIVSLSKEPIVYSHRVHDFKPMFSYVESNCTSAVNNVNAMNDILKSVS